MQQVAQYDSLVRRREKQRAREQDDRALREGAYHPKR